MRAGRIIIAAALAAMGGLAVQPALEAALRPAPVEALGVPRAATSGAPLGTPPGAPLGARLGALQETPLGAPLGTPPGALLGASLKAPQGAPPAAPRRAPLRALLGTLLGTPLSAQEPLALPPLRGSAVVTGQVLAEETGEPMRSAGVDLLFASDSLQVASVVTGPEGRFRIERVPEGTFFVRISNLGYGTVTTETFEVAAAETRALGELRLPIRAVELEPITVSAERTVVTYEADRTSYNVGVMPGTEGASVTETLGSIPELEVDIDGRVMLNNQPVTIHINGREAPMSGEALAIFLEQFPADYLQQIEVLDNPSARYDAAGTGGIVNLVMKEGVELGLSGSVFANAGTRGQYGVGGRGTLQRGPLTVNSGGFVRLSDSENTGYDLRQNLHVDPAFLRQDTWSDRSGLSSNADLRLRYEPTERSRLHLQGRVSGSGNDSEGLTTTTHLDALESPILAYERARASDARSLAFDVSTGLDIVWERRVHELEVELELQRGTRRANSRDEITEDPDVEDENELLPAELTLEDEDELERELSLEIDYMRGWGDGGRFEIGYDGSRMDSDADRLVRLIDDPLGPDGPGGPGEGVLTNRGHREWETSHSVYGTLQRRFGGVSVQAGLRAEQVDLRFELPHGESFGNTYRNLFPSANVSYRHDERRNVRLSYSRRVNRPGISVLSPVNRSTDPLNRRVGNPDVEPQFTHRVNLNASWRFSSGSLRLSPSYSATRNGWAQITSVDAQGISTRTYQNIASSESWGASLTYSLNRRGGWRGNVSLSARHDTRDASNLDPRYSGSSLRLSSRANINGSITDDLSAQANLSYQPPTDLPQGRRDARYRADLGLRYQLFDNRASVRLSLRDPFALQRSSSRLADVDYILIGRSQESTRSAQLSVTWSLGGGGRFRGGGGRR